MPKRLLQGASVKLTGSDGEPIKRLLIGATWTNTSIDIDMSALLLGAQLGKFTVASEHHFLFRNRRTTPDRSAFLTYLPPGVTEGPDRAQIMLDFTTMDPRVSRVVIAMSALRPGGVLAEMGTLRTRAMDLDTGETMYVYQQARDSSLAGQCLSLWTLDRMVNRWDGRVTATQYPGGPPALVRDYGAKAT